MTESKIETPFDRGARILNAVIAEVDIPADLKGNAQSVIRMLAEFLPQLLAPMAEAPGSGATTTTQVSDEAAGVAWHNNVMDIAQNARPAKTRGERRARATPPAAAQKPAARPGPQPAVAPAQDPQPVLAGLPEADVQLVWNAYAMVVGLQRNQAERLSEALIAALGTRVDPARVVEILTSASIDAARLWRVALEDLAKA